MGVEKTQCYTFSSVKSVKPLNKGKCTVGGGFGAGGYWTTITFNGKEYTYEFSAEEENASDEYIRHAKTFKKISQNQVSNKTPLLYCQIDKPNHICYAEK